MFIRNDIVHHNVGHRACNRHRICNPYAFTRPLRLPQAGVVPQGQVHGEAGALLQLRPANMADSADEHPGMDRDPPDPHNVLLLHARHALFPEERREAAVAAAPPGGLQRLLVCPPPAGDRLCPPGDALILHIPHQAVVQENGTYVFLFIFLMVSPSLKCQFCLPFQTWMYLAVPVVFYASERSIRKIREKSYRVSIIKVE